MSASLSKYRSAFYLSQESFDLLQLNTFPIDPFQIFKMKRGEPVFAITVQQYNSTHTQNPLSIKDAKCFYYPGKAYLIIYNSGMPKNRIRFSLIHELAHIILGHLNNEHTEICRGEDVHSRLYCIMEGEANTFTGNFLAPPILIREKLSGSDFNSSMVSSFFGLSDAAAANYRRKDYQEWLSTVPAPYEQNILERCRVRLFPKRCIICGSIAYGKNSNFCSICGNALVDVIFNEEMFNPMVYSCIQQDQDGRPIICPRCGNENPLPVGDFCIICGAPIYNRCADTEKTSETGYQYLSSPCEAGNILPGNARYCPYCGNETTYFQAGILEPWIQEYQENQSQGQPKIKKISYASNKAV